MVDHTPSGAVSAGDVIVTNDTPKIAHNDIAAGALGALAARGGVYTVPKAAGSSTAIADDKKVYWDDTNNVITTSAASGANKAFGITIGASLDADTTQTVLHAPF